METFAWRGSSANSDQAKVAVLLPGANYPVEAPLLFWVAEMLVGSGWHVQAVRWTLDDAARSEPYEYTANAAQQAIADAPTTETTLIVAKSFGTLCIPWADEADIPGLWLTPILTDEKVRATLAATSRRDVLIGGSRDELWDGGRRDEKASTFIEIAGADHGLQIPGDWGASMDAHRDVVTHAENFVAAM
ncbi:hypothetical protein [Arthrobacter roseus]|uniref:hypothetical protein n=1 Tax=Arthrobacter roseus TaxID=136274 RepID=UPI00196654B2|nr:hypothetical protein [Arthrobacter roseus]MBM7847070.1 hypothetical protein [Arthrobacter roseus]